MTSVDLSLFTVALTFTLTNIATTMFYFPFYQHTPLHVATREGRDYTVECLVRKGAKITITKNDGVSGLYY